jgi:hypothetical protein
MTAVAVGASGGLNAVNASFNLLGLKLLKHPACANTLMESKALEAALEVNVTLTTLPVPPESIEAPTTDGLRDQLYHKPATRGTVYRYTLAPQAVDTRAWVMVPGVAGVTEAALASL